ncbi:MAG: hypothetical protein HYZ53_30700 [Planctomycetes bacterium]|nr:hypothetical protein [Planctomycetota bacterium]
MFNAFGFFLHLHSKSNWTADSPACLLSLLSLAAAIANWLVTAGTRRGWAWVPMSPFLLMGGLALSQSLR